jgi:serine/threonine protein kinase
MAPEWRQSPTPITTKIDVYSFGMVLLEIVSGRRNLQPSSCNLVEADIRKPDWYFPVWALAKLESGSCMELVDPSLTQIVNPQEVERALQVAFWCINDMPEQRPSMSHVVQMLEGDIPVKSPVPRPKFLEMLAHD